jgi:hypothetical protein
MNVVERLNAMWFGRRDDWTAMLVPSFLEYGTTLCWDDYLEVCVLPEQALVVLRCPKILANLVL